MELLVLLHAFFGCLVDVSVSSVSAAPNRLPQGSDILLIGPGTLRQLADLRFFESLRTLRATDILEAFDCDLGLDVLIVAFEADVGGVLLLVAGLCVRRLGELVLSDVVDAYAAFFERNSCSLAIRRWVGWCIVAVLSFNSGAS